MGSQQGSNNINGTEVPGYISQYSFQGLGHKLNHGDKYYVTVTAVNFVDMEAYAFSSEIGIDSTPPTYGKVIDLHTTHRVDVTNTERTLAMDAKKCDTDEECDLLDATCSESMTSVSATWQAFQDPESGVLRYQIALGTFPGGGQIKPFSDIDLEDGVLKTQKRSTKIKNREKRSTRNKIVNIKEFIRNKYQKLYSAVLGDHAAISNEDEDLAVTF
ncbi:uncharacterized protein [Mytilus edulis]|uniref:uncharacterized protein n=1 Tax=Mytilus edulis TaxID=6550 RepID=UPI0039EE3CB3